MSDAAHRAAVAERAARAGGVVGREHFRESMAVETKAHKNDLVTEVDRDAQRQVIATVRQEFPGGRFVCEEESSPVDADVALLEAVPESGDAWVIDPIDGTGNYVRGNPRWATVVASVTEGEGVAVATYLPVEGDMYAAGPESVTRNGEPIQVSERADPETFVVAMIGRWSTHPTALPVGIVEETLSRFGNVRRTGSMQATLALVAAGAYDAAVMPDPPEPWDAIAGVHLLRRAGGTATNLAGERWTHDDALVVSNDQCHDRVVEAAAAALDAAAVTSD
jgi:myo-inositol-1(or 4)-monophosphatase